VTAPAPVPADRLAAALARFDAANAADPTHIVCCGVNRPYEVVYAEWLTDWVLRLAPAASEPLRLAARCQHLRRWEIPRDSHPATRAGYLQWRQKLKEFHAEQAAHILRDVGYEESIIQQVQALNLKKNFPADPEVRVLEDALCLVFLEHQFADLARKATPEKMVAALQKCWGKMTERAREEALKLSYAPKLQALLSQALSPR
jgi:hypothetical protein